MKTCNSCKETKEDNLFSYRIRKQFRNPYRVYTNMCCKCNSSGEGVSLEYIYNRARLKSKAFIDDRSKGYRKDGFTRSEDSDCAIDEMGLSYDEFDDIPGLDD